jgi:hypothetical protein
MHQSSDRRRVPREVLERMRMTAAVAASQIMEEHVRGAVELVRHGSDRAPVERLLSIYARVHGLGGADHQIVIERTLATLGREPEGAVGAGGFDAPRSPFRRLLLRIRGRMHDDLRDWIDRHTARVQLRILDIHMEHALAFVALARNHLSPARALGLYAELLELGDVTAAMLRLRVLDSLFEGAEADEPTPVQPIRAHLPLRVANDGG